MDPATTVDCDLTTRERAADVMTHLLQRCLDEPLDWAALDRACKTAGKIRADVDAARERLAAFTSGGHDD